MKKVINSAPKRRDFFVLASMAAASAPVLHGLWAEQRASSSGLATSEAELACIATFEEVWRTVRDRLTIRIYTGSIGRQSGNNHLPGATAGEPPKEVLAGRHPNNNALRALLRTRTTTRRRDREYYQLSDIFVVRLSDRADLNAALPHFLSRRWRSRACLRILRRPQCDYRRDTSNCRPNKPACSLAMRWSSPMVHRFSRCSHFVVVGVVVGLRGGAFMQISVTPVDIEPNKMFLDFLQCPYHHDGRRRSIGYVHVLVLR